MSRSYYEKLIEESNKKLKEVEEKNRIRINNLRSKYEGFSKTTTASFSADFGVGAEDINTAELGAKYGGEGLVDVDDVDGGFSETTTPSFSADFVAGAVDGITAGTSGDTAFNYGFQIGLSTDFTGEDSLDITIDAGKPERGTIEMNTNDMGDSLKVDGVSYTFPLRGVTAMVGDNTDESTLFTTACVYGGFSDTLDDCGKVNTSINGGGVPDTITISLDQALDALATIDTGGDVKKKLKEEDVKKIVNSIFGSAESFKKYEKRPELQDLYKLEIYSKKDLIEHLLNNDWYNAEKEYINETDVTNPKDLILKNSSVLINTVYANNFLDDKYRKDYDDLDSLSETLLELIYKKSVKISWTTGNNKFSKGKSVFVEIYDTKDGNKILEKQKLFDRSPNKGDTIEKEFELDSSYKEIAVKLMTDNDDGSECSKLVIEFDGLKYNFTKVDNNSTNKIANIDNTVGWLDKDHKTQPKIRWYTNIYNKEKDSDKKTIEDLNKQIEDLNKKITSSETNTMTTKTVRFATEGAYPPWNFVNDKEKLDGFDIELGNELCKRAGLRCEWVQNDWDSLITNLKSGEYDVIISGMSITEERQKVIDFTEEYYPTEPSSFVGLVSADNSVIKDVVATRSGTIHAAYVASSDATLIEFATSEETIAAVRNGQANAVLDYNSYLETLVNESDDLKIIGESIPIGKGIGMGIRKSDNKLLKKLNSAIELVKKDGTLNKMIVKWFGDVGQQFDSI